jgi:hypothetical protein
MAKVTGGGLGSLTAVVPSSVWLRPLSRVRGWTQSSISPLMRTSITCICNEGVVHNNALNIRKIRVNSVNSVARRTDCIV